LYPLRCTQAPDRKLNESERRIFLKRLQMCRELFRYVLESKEWNVDTVCRCQASYDAIMTPTGSFKPIPALTAQQVKDLLREKDPGVYNLIDVRQPGEYGQGHIPGAALVPLGDLYEREQDLDRSRPTVLYCRSGNRSRAAASILLDAGFSNVFSMEGGIQAWRASLSTVRPRRAWSCSPAGKSP
jgi:rhodanese-related sulfurtransferase